MAGVMTPRMMAYSAIVWASSPQRDRIQLKKAISRNRRQNRGAECLVLGIPAIRRECEANAHAAPAPGPGAPPGPAGVRASRDAPERDLLLSLVLQSPLRRSVRPLDARGAYAAVRPGFPVLPDAWGLLERGPPGPTRPDGRHRRGRSGRGRQLVVGSRLGRGCPVARRDPRREATAPAGRGPARTLCGKDDRVRRRGPRVSPRPRIT